MLGPLRDSGCTVFTQPGFIADRGEQFKAGATPSEWGDLYRFKSLRARGIEVIASSDAPYGPVSPPAVVRAAMTRTTNAGLVLGAGERVSADEAWRGYWRPKDLARGGEPLRVRRDGPADLCLVGETGDGDLRGESSPVVAVWRGGVRVR
jgi:predicted amidohydrolase YtcJ